MSEKKYDAIVIGAGMSGLACAIRLAMFDKKVALVEKHSKSGGLNSYYRRKNLQTGDFRLFDSGLHALTNFAAKGEKRKPLTKLLKQLRIKHDELKLKEQTRSSINFQSEKLYFSNDFELLLSEIESKFPSQIDNFRKLNEKIIAFNELDLSLGFSSCREFIASFIKDELLADMILCPLLIYGSAWEHDMDLAQFVVMYKSIYLEGFSRPEGGVRTILEILEKKLSDLGGQLIYRFDVESIIHKDDQVVGIRSKKGEELFSSKIFSSAGAPETYRLCGINEDYPVGKMSFVESIIFTDKKLPSFDETIQFYNHSDRYLYRKPDQYFDTSSAVICAPDNYERDNIEGEGCFRVTFMANYDLWKQLNRPSAEYKEQKEKVYTATIDLLSKQIPGFNGLNVNFKDVFSPITIERYTYHLDGTVYGSTKKLRDGKTDIDGLYVIGTDQGFLGIVGAMLSGISIGNMYGLMES